MIDRRFFLKLTGLLASLGAVNGLPAATRALAADDTPDRPTRAPGTYQFSGRVRIDAPLVEISGITNAQQISWSGTAGAAPRVAGFTSFESFDEPWQMPAIHVQGGHLEALSVVPVLLA